MQSLYLKLIAHRQRFAFSQLLGSKLRGSVYLVMLFVGTSLSNVDMAVVGAALLHMQVQAWLSLVLLSAFNAALTLDVETSSPAMLQFEATLPIPGWVGMVSSALGHLLTSVPVIVTVCLFVSYAPAGPGLLLLLMVTTAGVCTLSAFLSRVLLLGMGRLRRQRRPRRYTARRLRVPGMIHHPLIRLRVLLRSYRSSLAMDGLVLVLGFAIYSLLAGGIQDDPHNGLVKAYLFFLLLAMSRLGKYVTYLKNADNSYALFLNTVPLTKRSHALTLVSATLPLLMPYLLVFGWAATTNAQIVFAAAASILYLVIPFVFEKHSGKVAFLCSTMVYFFV